MVCSFFSLEAKIPAFMDLLTCRALGIALQSFDLDVPRVRSADTLLARFCVAPRTTSQTLASCYALRKMGLYFRSILANFYQDV